MFEPIHVTIEEKEFVINKLPILKALYLDKTLVSLIVPSLAGIDGLSDDAEVDIGKMFKAVSEGLSNLEEQKLQKFFVDLFVCVQYMPTGATPMHVTASTMDAVFDSVMSMYKLAFEVMKGNKFSPFALVGDGSAMGVINGFLKPTKKQKKKDGKSETLESSQGNSNGNGPFGQ